MQTSKLEKTTVVLISKLCARCGQIYGPTAQDVPAATFQESAGPATDCSVATLSSRERQIIQLIQQAKSNKEIAYELSLTVGTVKEYVYRIFRKLGVTNRTELALWSRDYQVRIAS